VGSSKSRTLYSKLSRKSRTALPREVRERLGVSPGDRLRYVLDDAGVRIERGAPNAQGDPFATFTEWASEADDEAYAGL
jgi:antitoxin PrlF